MIPDFVVVLLTSVVRISDFDLVISSRILRHGGPLELSITVNKHGEAQNWEGVRRVQVSYTCIMSAFIHSPLLDQLLDTGFVTTQVSTGVFRNPVKRYTRTAGFHACTGRWYYVLQTESERTVGTLRPSLERIIDV